MFDFLKQKPKPNNDFYNLHHADFIGIVEPAFKGKDGIQYYRFMKEINLPYGRYQMVQTYYLQYDLRLDHKLFKQYIEAIEKSLDGSAGQVNIGKAFELISKMKARAELAFDPNQAYNLASIIYFDDTEDLYKYDLDYNRTKIARWKEANDLSFFYTKPLDDLLGLKHFSELDLAAYIKAADQILTDLTLDTQ